MAKRKHYDILEQGAEVWNRWREQHPEEKPNIGGLGKTDFSHVDLSGANLSGADLTFVDFRETNLSGANLSRADLSGANLSGANLSEVSSLGKTNLSNVNFSRAKLSRKDLSGRNFCGLNFSGADLRGTYLRGTDLRRANLSGADLRGATLSEKISHVEHLDLNDLSPDDWEEINLEAAALRGADLNGARLDGVDLSAMDLTDVLLKKANLTGANLNRTNLSGVDLSEANLSEAMLVETILTQAILTGCNVYGISVWKVDLKSATQDNLVITPENEPTITVDDLEVAQFIYLLLNHQKLRNVLNAVTERGVLLLGRFGGGGLEVLQAVAAKLREEKYLPIIFDFERPRNRSYTETVKTLAGLSRFIIADLSGPSVPLELYATVPHFKIPFVPILEARRKSFAMAVDLLEYPWVVRPPVMFASTDELVSLVPTKIITPAEEKYQARQQLLDELFRPS